MKCLVTGSAGFIASKVVIRLKELGHEIIGYDIVADQDLLNLKDVEEAVKGADVVYHIAAQADLTKMQEIDAARDGVLRNVEATHNVAYACAKYKKWLIFASTVCVYGNVDSHPENEDKTLPNPSELYACSKYAAEWLIRGYAKNFDMPYTILRFATIYGEGMREAMGMHIFFRQALQGHTITVHGDGKQDRTLTYIDDLVDGIVAVLDHPEAKGHVINLTATEAVSAIKMAHDVASATGNACQIDFTPQRPNQTFHEDFDTSKAHELLGWKAKTPWLEGVKKTHVWMKTQMKTLDTTKITGQGNDFVSPK